MVLQSKEPTPDERANERKLLPPSLTSEQKVKVRELWTQFLDDMVMESLVNDVTRRDAKIQAIKETGWFDHAKDMSNNEIMRFIEGTENLKLGIIRIPKEQQITDRSVNITFIAKGDDPGKVIEAVVVDE